MQFTIAVLALAGAAFASPAPQQVTVTAASTTIVTITTCPPAVVDCPVRYATETRTQTYIYPVGPGGPSVPTGNVVLCPGGVVCPPGVVPTGTGGGSGGVVPCPGGKVCSPGGTGAMTYMAPTPTSPTVRFTGAASHMQAGAALGAVGAVAALLL